MERIPSAQPPPASLSGMDLSHMYHVFKPRKGLKRCEDSKDTYKLPHRLIEKKRRDRINECIAQLKDLLPEHLKLTTLGHLEKAVVLELTLKHLRSLSSLIEQQQQQILALQRGSPCEGSRTSGEEMFLSGFQLCAEEALRFLQDGEQCELVSHLHRVASNISQSPTRTQISPKGTATNCVPVIQRAAPLPPSEQSGSDTDTDSGYGEVEKYTQEKQGVLKEEGTVSPKVDMVIKQEPEETPRKRSRIEAFEREHRICSSDIQSMASYPNPHPLCLPFYLIPPSASTYLPMLDKCWYPGSMPMLYPVLPHSGSAVSPLDSSLLQALKKVPTIGMDTKE